MANPDSPQPPGRPDREAIAMVVRMLRFAREGALATLDADGAPFVSHVATVLGDEGEPVFLLSHLAVHSTNLARDSRASLLVVTPAADTDDPTQAARVTLIGRVTAPDDGAAARQRFLEAHATAAGYADFADFSFYRLDYTRAHAVFGFGRIISFDAGEAAAIKAAATIR